MPPPETPADLVLGPITEAIRRQASDLSFDPDEDGGLVALIRVDGVRLPIGSIPANRAASAIARLKALANIPAYVLDEPQDGSIPAAAVHSPGDLRLAVIPTVRGPRASLRLPALGALPASDGLGLPNEVVGALRRLVRRPDGLLVIAGPTGSGKTTTIHSLLRELAHQRPDRLLLTLEDPVERRLPGVVQVEVRQRPGWGFQEALTAALRQDPDVIVVGEIRDPATAAACLRAALTGHLVVTTIHAGRADEVVPRLLEMGMAPDLLLPPLLGVVAQRLVRLVHTPCGGSGCDECHGGHRGRQVIADLLEVDAAARATLRGGGRPPLASDMQQQAASLISSRRTTANEVQRVLGDPAQ